MHNLIFTGMQTFAQIKVMLLIKLGLYVVLLKLACFNLQQSFMASIQMLFFYKLTAPYFQLQPDWQGYDYQVI